MVVKVVTDSGSDISPEVAKELGITVVPETANALKTRISTLIDAKQIQASRIGAGLGVHGGPDTLLVAARSG